MCVRKIGLNEWMWGAEKVEEDKVLYCRYFSLGGAEQASLCDWIDVGGRPFLSKMPRLRNRREPTSKLSIVQRRTVRRKLNHHSSTP